MKKTLYEITLDVLNAINGDEINSIVDTIESLQTAQDIENIYYDIIGRKDWQFLRKFRELDSLSDSTRPTHLLIPRHTSKMETLKYNKKKEGNDRNFYTEIFYKYPDEFLEYVNGRDNTKDNYDEIVDVDGAKFTIRNDSHPVYYTSFDDIHIVMDNYDGRIENTLQGRNTQALLFITPQWSVTDNFVPELPEEMFPQFIAECKTYAILKKEDNLVQKTEQTATRHQRHLSQTHGVVQGGVRYPNYGRTPRKAGSTRRHALFGPRS